MLKVLKYFTIKREKILTKEINIVSNKKILSTGVETKFQFRRWYKRTLIYYQNFKLTNDTNNVFILKK